MGQKPMHVRSLKSKGEPENLILQPRLMLKKNIEFKQRSELSGIQRKRCYPVKLPACERKRPKEFHVHRKGQQTNSPAIVMQGDR